MNDTYEKIEFTNDFMFRRVMEDPKICKRMLEILLDIKIDHIENLTPEFTLQNVYNGRGVRLDVYLKDSTRVFDVEMQTSVKGDEGLRARYYQSEMDMKILKRGESYRKLKESYVIFLCTKDPFGEGLPIYTFKNLCIQDNSIKLDDRAFKYFFNASAADKIQNNKEVKDLLSYISTNVPQSAFTKEIEEEVEASSNDAEWRKGLMTFEMILEEKKEEGFAQGIEKGREEGAFNTRLETAKNLITMRLPAEKITEATGLPLEQILELQLEKNKSVIMAQNGGKDL